MKNISLLLLAATLCVLRATPMAGQAGNDTLRTYIFGHSLINHELQVNPTPSNETSVPHWFQLLAVEAGYGYAVAGQYGFLNGHAANLPPTAQWGFDTVPSAWESDFEPFSAADFDNILMTPANFAQWQGPSVNYWNDTLSPISATNMLIDWTAAQEDSLTFYIYENWPDMAPYLANGFPPSATEWSQYNTYLNAGFHDWFLEYHDSVILAHPEHCVRMIPVGPLISGLLSQPPFDQIAVSSLYEDDAPHGRPTTYFLAVLITYMAMYEEPAPSTYQVPSIIDPIVAANYSAAVSYLWNGLLTFNDSLGNNRVFCSSPAVSMAEQVEIDFPFPYPNPSNGIFRMQGNMQGFEMEVLDARGMMVSKRLENGAVDLGGMANGLYLIRLRNQDTGLVKTYKVLKQP